MLPKKRNRRLLVVVSVIVLLVMGFPAMSALSGEKVKITYWHQWTGQWTPVLEDLAHRFNVACPDVQVKAVVIPQDFGRKLLTAVASGNVPDVVSLTGAENLMFAERKALVPIDEIMEPEELTEFKDWAMPVVTEVNTYKGHIWALSPYIDVESLYYNKNMFQETGLDPNKPPLDIDTLDKYAEKLTTYDAAGNIDRIGFYPSWGLDLWGTVFGGTLMKGDEVWFNKDPKILEALKWIVSYSKKYDVKKITAFESSLAQERAAALDPFISGRKAMEQQGQWVIINIANYAPKGFSYGVTPCLPYPPGGRENSLLVRSSYGALAIPKGSKHPKEGCEFALFWVGYGHERDRAITMVKGGWMPLAKSPWSQPIIRDYLSKYPEFDTFRKILFARNWTMLKTPVDAYLFDRLGAARDYARLLKKTPQKALDDAAREVQKELNRLLRKR